MGPHVLIVDNYDSFVYNLYQYLGELGSLPTVVRHDELGLEAVLDLHPDAVVVSPGPGRPEGAGISNEVIAAAGASGVPVLGVCLGHQCIASVFGGEIVGASEIVHGKSSPVAHDGKGVFAGLPNPLMATRYHSLVVEESSLPAVLEVTARTPNGLIMGIRHRELPIEGVQFHPESILTGEAGKLLLANFLAMAARAGTGATAKGR